MRLKLPSGRGILVSPLLLWESRRKTLLTVRTAGVFHPSHVTTRLCLGLMEEALQIGPCESLLDVGCGCGVLALAAAAMGVGRAVGADIQWRAARVSRENALANNLSTATHWIAGSCAAFRGTFQWVVANLPYAVLEDLLDDLARLLATGGTMLLSGFQDVDWYGLCTKMQRLNLETLRTVCGDLTFYGAPPSGSFTWMAVMARKEA